MRPRVFFIQSFNYISNYFHRGIWLESSSWMSFDSCISQYICPVHLSKVSFIILFYMYRICRAITSPILNIGKLCILLFALISLTSALPILLIISINSFWFHVLLSVDFSSVSLIFLYFLISAYF